MKSVITDSETDDQKNIILSLIILLMWHALLILGKNISFF